MPRRERWLRLALITVAAALVGTAFSVYSQRSRNAPLAAAERTADAASGVVETEIEVVEDDRPSQARVVSRFAGGDFATEISTSGDGTPDEGDGPARELRSVADELYYRLDGEDWVRSDDPSPLVLDEATALPPAIVGWTTGGVAELIEALDLPEDLSDGTGTATITVAEVRALVTVPAPLTLVVDRGWGLADDQPVEVTIGLADGHLREIAVEATDSDPDRAGGPLRISIVTTYDRLDSGQAIEVPTDGSDG